MAKEKKKQSKKSRAVYNVLITICLLVFLGSAGALGYQLWDYHKAAQVRDGLADLIVEPDEGDAAGTVDENGDPVPKPLVDYSKLAALNPDFKGWVEIADTPISYPVVQAADNDEYLHTDFYGDYHKLGTVFADCRAQLTPEKTSDNVVLYGHSAADGSYFAAVRKYKDIDYYKEHPIISFNTTYESADWIIIGEIMIDALDDSDDAFLYNNHIEFADEAAFNEFVTGVAQRSYFVSPADVQYGDKFITLSTCDYDFDEARFAIVARKLRPGETVDSFDIAGTQVNQNRQMPDRWYA